MCWPSCCCLHLIPECMNDGPASGHQEAAETSVLEANARGVPGALLERCRLLWDRDKGHRAILELQLALQQGLEHQGQGGWRAG